MTNRELYLAITGLVARNRRCERSLEEYLRALLRHFDDAGREELSVYAFLEGLEAGFHAAPAPFDESWRSARPDENSWKSVLVEQIVDLREMEEQAHLQNQLRYFGIKSPRGHEWFNFDPFTYLECGADGTFGGWQPGDSTGRVPTEEYVPEPEFAVDWIPWRQFTDFLRAGQWYE